MGTQKKAFGGKGRGFTATELFSESEPHRLGRRLKMWFVGNLKPELHRIEFRCGHPTEFGYLEKRANEKDNRFTFTAVPQALSLLFLEFKCAGLEERERGFTFPGSRYGSLAASLDDAIGTGSGKIFTLFTEFPLDGGEQCCIDLVLGRTNPGGRDDNERQIFVKSDFLAADCVEVFWDSKPMDTSDKLRDLGARIRTTWKLEPSHQPDPPKREPKSAKGEESAAEHPAQDASTKATEPQAKSDAPKNTATKPVSGEEHKSETKQAEAITPPIDPKLFVVSPTNETWPDDMPIVTFNDEFDWTLRNAFEGVLVLGETGGGKSSGSGATIAEAFLHAGFGGLVLTVKEGEAEHWRKLCIRCGRERDLVVVSQGGDWRLNLLAYAAQRPGRGSGLSTNLVTFCRNLLKISSRSQGPQHRESIWEEAGDQLLGATFELFLLAGESITFDRLANFVGAAPTGNLPATEADWVKVPVFGSIIRKAKKAHPSLEDERMFGQATNYWFNIYPGYPAKVRTSITLGIYAMLDAFRGRDVPSLISSNTNLTPESSVMSGKIVVVDLPIKVFEKTGLLIQSSWKFLFQTALERQNNANNPHRRPCFLWEDDGQHWFSEHDHHFQATARSARVCRVILSQNLHGFYKELGSSGGAAVNSVFGNLNTKVFHANNDPLTNDWSSKQFGSVIRTRQSISQNPPPPARDFLDSVRQTLDPPNTTGYSEGEQWEPAVRPEEFNLLRNGGKENNFEVDAYITWPGLAKQAGEHFIKTTFLQNTEL